MTRYDGLVTGPGPSFGPDFWEPVMALLDTVWPALRARTDRAAALGFPWARDTTPFAWFEDGRAVAHVGVLRHPVRLLGEDRVIAGLHAVCSHPEARGRGLVRRLLTEACAHVDARYDAAKLHTDHPDLYARFGFRVIPTWTWATQRAGRGAAPEHRAARRLDPSVPADAEHLVRAYRNRVPPSDVFGSHDRGWLTTIDAALARTLGQWFHAPPASDGGADWVAAWALEGDTLVIHDVAGPVLPDLDTLLGAVPSPFARVRWTFPPDRFDASALPSPVTDGAFQVRGRWPDDSRVGISPLSEH